MCGATPTLHAAHLLGLYATSLYDVKQGCDGHLWELWDLQLPGLDFYGTTPTYQSLTVSIKILLVGLRLLCRNNLENNKSPIS